MDGLLRQYQNKTLVLLALWMPIVQIAAAAEPYADLYAAAIGEPPARAPAPAKKPPERTPAPAPVTPAPRPEPAPTPVPDTTAKAPPEQPAGDDGLKTKILIGGAVALGLAALGGGGGGGGGGDAPPASTSFRSP